MKKDAQLNVYNIKQMRAQPPQEFEFVRFDPNNNCNLRCVYCHNHRSKDIIDTDEFYAFLEKNVISVENFQVGCIMEPTLDSRLGDLMLLIHNSPGKPRNRFILQTNGTLLHKHDYEKMLNAGLTHLYISIDSVNPVTLSFLRGGTNLAIVQSNILRFRRECPNIEIAFITTVTNINIFEMEDLVAYGLEVGVSNFVFREVFYHPENDMVDHSKMPALLLKGENDFLKMKERIISRFGKLTNLEFADLPALEKSLDKIKTDSFR